MQAEMNGMERLLFAVLTQAVSDMRAGDEEARAFLLSPDGVAMFGFLGISPESVRRRVPARPLPMEGEWLTVPQAAARWGYHPEYLRQLIRSGKVTAHKQAGHWEMQVESVNAYRAGRLNR